MSPGVRFARPLALALLVAALALPSARGPAAATTDTSRGDSGGEGSGPFAGLASLPTANLFSGAMSLTLPILIPPGRKNATPSLALGYSSAARGATPLGRGWSLAFGAVVRSAKYGVPACLERYAPADPSGANSFELHLPGGSTELVADGPNLYKARVDESYLEVRLDPVANRWEARDRRGMVYRFGLDDDARAFSGAPVFLDPASCSFTSVWALGEIQDEHANLIEIRYENDENALYPVEVLYGDNALVNPTQRNHPFRVAFTHATPRRNPALSYASGVRVAHRWLVDSIEVSAKADVSAPFAPVRSYALSYDPERDLLTDVQGSDLPPQRFVYSGSDFGSVAEHAYSPPAALAASGGADHVRHWAGNTTQRSVMDMNGDGRPDLVHAEPFVWRVYPGTNAGFDHTPILWQVPVADAALNDDKTAFQAGGDYDWSYTWNWKDTFDITGDGVADFVAAQDGGDCPFPEPCATPTWKIYPGVCDTATSCRFATPPQAWLRPGHASPDPSDALNTTSTVYTIIGHGTGPASALTVRGMLDLNGDSLPDYVDTGLTGSAPWKVYLNNGGGFDPAHPLFAQIAGPLDRSIFGSRKSSHTLLAMMDFNGDGLPDRLQVPGLYFEAASETGFTAEGEAVPVGHPASIGTGTPLDVFLNTGSGFEALPVRTILPSGRNLRYVRGEGSLSNPDRFETQWDFADVNGDGLPDLVDRNFAISGCCSDHTSPFAPRPQPDPWRVQLNLGGGRLALPAVVAGAAQAPRIWPGMEGRSIRRQNGVGRPYTRGDLFDCNGDGILDQVDTALEPWTMQVLGNLDGEALRPPDILIEAHNGLGGTTEIRYAPSTLAADQNTSARGVPDGVPDLPSVAWVATGIRSTDGLCDPGAAPDRFAGDPVAGNPCIASGHEIVRRFAYEGGLFDARSREFRGFRKVTESDVFGNRTESLFSQEDLTRGKLLRREVFAGADRISRETSIWHAQPSAGTPERIQIHLAELRSERFVPGAEGSPQDQCSLTRNEAPDEWGRIARSCTLPCGGGIAFPATPGSCANPVEGQINTVTAWANPTSSSWSLRERPAQLVTRYWRDGAPVTLSSQRFYYDGLSQTVTRGDPTRVDSLGPGVVASVENAFDVYGNLVSTTTPHDAADPRSFTTTDSFDPNLFSLYPVAVANPLGHLLRTVTDLRYGKAVAATDYNGQRTEWAHDSLGRVTRERRPGDAPLGDPCTGCRAAEHEYRYGDPAAPDFLGRLTRVAVERREPWSETGSVRLEAYVDALGRPRLTRRARVIGSDAAPQLVIEGQRSYDAGGRVARIYAPYVASGAVAEEPAGVAFTHFDYALNGGSAVDPLGRVHRETPPDQRATRHFYEGRVTRRLNPAGGELLVEVDDLGRTRRRQESDGAGPALVLEYEVDGAGRVLEERIAGSEAAVSSFVYDALGRRVQAVLPDSGLWEYGYDVAGNLVYQNDPKSGQHVELVHDPLGRILLRCLYASDAQIGQTPHANPSACAEGPGRVAESSYRYDDADTLGIGRLRSAAATPAAGDASAELYDYDARGRVAALRKTVRGVAARFEFDYDAADHVTQIRYPDGELVRYAYDRSGSPARIESPGYAPGVYVSAVEYDLFGRVQRLVHGEGAAAVEDRVEFFAAGEGFRPARAATSRSGAAYSSLRYAYTPELGKLARIEDERNGSSAPHSAGASYAYDALGRLALAAADGGAGLREDYRYDALGNLCRKAGAPLWYDASHPHRLEGFGDAVYRYDANGSRVSLDRLAPPTFRSYDWQDLEYDALGRLVGIATGAHGATRDTIRFAYDHGDRRVVKQVAGAETVLYFGRLAEYSDGDLLKYYYLGERLIATRLDHVSSLAQLRAGAPFRPPPPWRIPARLSLPLFGGILLLLAAPRPPRARSRSRRPRVAPARAAGAALALVWGMLPASLFAPRAAQALWCGVSGIVLHHHPDHLGSTQLVTDGDGDLNRVIRFEPYGRVRGRYGASGDAIPATELVRREFTSYESELHSGLQYAGARFYDPGTGQFLSPDPAGQFASPYAYGPGDPLHGTDPSGADFGIGALFAVAAVALAVANAVYSGVKTGSFEAAAESLVLGAVALSFAQVPLVASIGFAAVTAAPAIAEGEWEAAALSVGAALSPSVGLARSALAVARADGEGGRVFGALGLALGVAGLAYGLADASQASAASGASAAASALAGTGAALALPMSRAVVGLFQTVAGDLAAAVVGLLATPYGILESGAEILGGILGADRDLIRQGAAGLLHALVPRYGWYAGPGWGVNQWGQQGVAPFDNPIDEAAKTHDIHAGQPGADRALIAAVWSRHDLGPYGQIYRIGLTALFAARIRLGAAAGP